MAVRYAYGDSAWGDLLTAWNGNTVTSDAIGNTLSDGTRTYTWQNGRELATIAKSGTTWTNTYNADGIRTKRTNGSTTYGYVYNGGSLSQMTVDGTVMNFAYDASGTPMAVVYNGTTYYYTTNLQGDVTAILNASGTAVVTYTYDAWGNILSTSGTLADTLGQANPLRYRGYVYDHETGLYYLQSRYYDPAIGRFINADAFASTGQGILGNNMFAYCLNNPVNRVDPSGRASFEDLDYATDPEDAPADDVTTGGGALGFAIGAAAGTLLSNNLKRKKPINLPARKKIKIDMDHISSGHMPNGSRNPDGNKDVFWGLTYYQVVKAIMEAYSYSEKISTQGPRIRLIGYSPTIGRYIEMWLNTVSRMIETAYPK